MFRVIARHPRLNGARVFMHACIEIQPAQLIAQIDAFGRMRQRHAVAADGGVRLSLRQRDQRTRPVAIGREGLQLDRARAGALRLGVSPEILQRQAASAVQHHVQRIQRRRCIQRRERAPWFAAIFVDHGEADVGLGKTGVQRGGALEVLFGGQEIEGLQQQPASRDVGFGQLRIRGQRFGDIFPDLYRGLFEWIVRVPEAHHVGVRQACVRQCEARIERNCGAVIFDGARDAVRLALQLLVPPQ
jgi:hypothetical protein